jgi:hypothetical protein
MAVPPAALDPLRDEVRRLIRTGWQPAPAPEPSRDQLAALIDQRLARQPVEPVPA